MPIDLVCANPRCARTFTFRGGPAHLARASRRCCSRSCQNTRHGLAGTPEHKVWERAKRRAWKNGVPFDMRVEDVPKIPATCPVLGIEIRANDVAGPLDSSPSIDRLVPELGYVPGNVRIISNRANRLRGDGTAEELRRIADDAARVEHESAEIARARIAAAVEERSVRRKKTRAWYGVQAGHETIQVGRLPPEKCVRRILFGTPKEPRTLCVVYLHAGKVAGVAVGACDWTDGGLALPAAGRDVVADEVHVYYSDGTPIYWTRLMPGGTGTPTVANPEAW